MLSYRHPGVTDAAYPFERLGEKSRCQFLAFRLVLLHSQASLSRLRCSSRFEDYRVGFWFSAAFGLSLVGGLTDGLGPRLGTRATRAVCSLTVLALLRFRRAARHLLGLALLLKRLLKVALRRPDLPPSFCSSVRQAAYILDEILFPSTRCNSAGIFVVSQLRRQSSLIVHARCGEFGRDRLVVSPGRSERLIALRIFPCLFPNACSADIRLCGFLCVRDMLSDAAFLDGPEFTFP